MQLVFVASVEIVKSVRLAPVNAVVIAPEAAGAVVKSETFRLLVLGEYPRTVSPKVSAGGSTVKTLG